LQALGRLAEIIGARAEPSDLARAFTQLGAAQPTDRWAVVVLEGLGRGLQNGGQSLRKLWDTPPADLKNGIARVQPFFAAAAKQAGDDSQPVAARLAAVRLLGYGPFSASAGVWPALLAPSQPSDLQLAAVRALAGQDRPEVPQLLLGSWAGYSPAVRREVLEALFARADRLPALLDAVEAKTIPAAGLDPARLLQLRKLPDAKLRERAEKALAAAVAPDRKKVLADYDGVLDLTANADRGREVFRKNCMTCHRLENQGVQVGPDLAAAIGTKTPADLLVAILDPSREVDPRYVNYLVTTSTGRVLTGIISAETPASLTLRRAEGAEDTILRTQIDEVQATAQSLMPEGIEKQVGRQEMADLIAYLRQAVAK
jgi:putative heme-binding domain-containing protein